LNTIDLGQAKKLLMAAPYWVKIYPDLYPKARMIKLSQAWRLINWQHSLTARDFTPLELFLAEYSVVLDQAASE